MKLTGNLLKEHDRNWSGKDHNITEERSDAQPGMKGFSRMRANLIGYLHGGKTSERTIGYFGDSWKFA
jgi:hypothetical protein